MHPFIHLCIHSFIYSSIHSFMFLYFSFIYSFIDSFIYAFIHVSIHAFIPSFMHSFIHQLIYSFIQLFIHSYLHSLIYNFIHLCLLLIYAGIQVFTRYPGYPDENRVYLRMRSLCDFLSARFPSRRRLGLDNHRLREKRGTMTSAPNRRLQRIWKMNFQGAMLKRIEKCFSYTSNVSLLLLFFLFFSHCKIARTLPLPHLIPRVASNLAYPFKFAPQQPVQSPHVCLKVHFFAHGKLENLHQPSQN